MNSPRSRSAFTLLEIMIVMAVMITLATVLLKDTPDAILRHQIDAEDAALDALVADIVRSTEDTDFDDRNIATLSTDRPSSSTSTGFSTGSETPLTATNDWYTKIARLRGVTPAIGVAPSATAQPELYRILYNARGRQRFLFSRYDAESDQQRLILLSILDDGNLTFPSPGSGATGSRSARFDDIWNFDFDTDRQALPTNWTSGLTADQQTAWLDGRGDGSNLLRMRVRRISIPRHTITINNNHTSQNAYVAWHADGTTATDMTVAAGAGTAVSAGVLQGRRVTVKVGASLGSAVTKYQWILRKDTTVTVE